MTQTDAGLAWARRRIQASIDVKQTILESDSLLAQVLRVSRLLAQSLARGGQVLLFGNGGSAADAQHIAGELAGRFYLERRGLPVAALTSNPSTVTAIGNDYGFAEVFARQLEAHGRPGDVAVGLSTSGASPNVVRALAAARRLGLHTVALTGMNGGGLRDVADECLCVASAEIPRIQEAHMLLGHLICEWVERSLFAPEGDTLGQGSNHASH
jgi:D-sedoheptulose 7-phosphate isomerase